jgi:hypothetical protein
MGEGAILGDSTPAALRPSARGCAPRATPGKGARIDTTATRLRPCDATAAGSQGRPHSANPGLEGASPLGLGESACPFGHAFRKGNGPLSWLIQPNKSLATSSSAASVGPHGLEYPEPKNHARTFKE